MSYGFGVAVVLVLMLVAGYVWTYLRYGKEWGVLYDALYEHEPPRPLPPAVVPAILTQGSVQNAELAKGFAATLLEAARLGYLEIEETQDRGLLGTGLLKDTDLIYRLTAKGQAILSPPGRGELGRLLPEPAPGERALEPFEVAVLDAVFRRVMSDFSAMKDAGPQLLPMWESYLVYATALGVAEHLLANLKLVAAQLSQTVLAAAWYVGARGTGGGMGMPLASLESLTKSLENFHNLSRALSSSTSTGGGFSGGGGGGGGGGSSRAG